MKVTKAELIAALQGLPDYVTIELEMERPAIEDVERERQERNAFRYLKPGPITTTRITLVADERLAPASTDIEV